MSKRYYYDEKSDALYIHIKNGPEDHFEEIVPGIHIEFDDQDEIIGIEILGVSRFSEGSIGHAKPVKS